MDKLSEWHIEGRDVYIQDWETKEELSIKEAEEMLNKVAQLEGVVEPIKMLRTRYSNSTKTWTQILKTDMYVVLKYLEDALRALEAGGE